MKYRSAARFGVPISEVGLGCWQLGDEEWGDVSEQTAFSILRAAVGSGVNFLDTADCYGSGHSETTIGKFLQTLPNEGRHLFVATKLGRLKGYPDDYTYELFRQCTLESCERLQRTALDLTQLHCVPMRWLKEGKVFEWLGTLKSKGLIRHFGASVESMEEAKVCLAHAEVDSLQIIFNIFRQKPIDELFAEAKAKGVAIIVRLPLASGLLGGKLTKRSTFAAGDHRTFNRNGEQFSVGETFAGLPFEKGIDLVEELRGILPADRPMAEAALRWILDFDAVTAIIPGATKVKQAERNSAPSDAPRLPTAMHEALRRFYKDRVSAHIRGPY